ncbi:hypothetical protein [Burkholderia gladioli]|uniref:hypothetical protein n=1 Tax=Burkholderia gladioli TaxID=28095 RepID=UPI0013DD99BD|nr:hypothetical protein [Burkholderia gladioli]
MRGWPGDGPSKLSRHPRVRLAVLSNRLDAAALEPDGDWPALHDSYQQVLDKLRVTRAVE